MTALRNGRALYRQAEKTRQAGHRPAAVMLFQSAAAQLGEARAHAEQAQALHQVARTGWLAAYSLAPAALRQAADLYAELPDLPRQAAVLSDLARLLWQQGHYPSAEVTAHQALALVPGSAEAALRISLWCLLGEGALQREELWAAEGHFLQAALDSQTASDPLGQALSLSALARLALLQGRSGHAQRLLQLAGTLTQDDAAAPSARRALVQQTLLPLLQQCGLLSTAEQLAAAVAQEPPLPGVLAADLLLWGSDDLPGSLPLPAPSGEL